MPSLAAAASHGKGARYAIEPRTLPAALPGAALWQLTAGPGMHYLPYFYNPHLTPDGQRLLFAGSTGQSSRGHDAEQVFLLDRAAGEATQLTAASGRDQHWSPYIRAGIDGIRPQFIAWSQPDWRHALYWEGNTLRRVDVETLDDEPLYTQREDAVPQVLHCSAGGLVCWGYIPHDVQEGIRASLLAGNPMVWDEPLLARLEHGCGFVVYDLAARRAMLDVAVPFWVNHIQASPDGRRILFCQEGPWQRQRMWLYDVSRGEWGPLRVQDDGAAIGHEFWLDPEHVGYHGAYPPPAAEHAPVAPPASASPAPGTGTATPPQRTGERAVRHGFFGRLDVTTGERVELPASAGTQFYGHYHASPDARWIVTDGEITPDHISLAPFPTATAAGAGTGDSPAPSSASHRLHDPTEGAASAISFTPAAPHHWARSLDQRYHPHPHWHASGRAITFTGCEMQPDGTVATHAMLLDVPAELG